MPGARARARADLTAEIKAVARRHLAEEGAAGLSLRAIAREIGMVSSAVYRYVPSREHLLTALLIDSYNELGEVAERADAAVEDRDVLERWRSIGWAAYRWASDNREQYALLFGTPVPGYRAPEDTIGPASRFTNVLLALLADLVAAGHRPAVEPQVPGELSADLDRVRTLAGVRIDDVALLAGMQTWTALFGFIGFVLFGQFHNVVDDHDALARSFIDLLGRQLTGAGTGPGHGYVQGS